MWQLMALLLLRHALNLSNNNSDDEEDDPSAFFFVCQSLLLTVRHIVLRFAFLVITHFVLFCFVLSSFGFRQLFMLRAAGFLLPCYIMAWAISILQRRRQRQVYKYLENHNTHYT